MLWSRAGERGPEVRLGAEGGLVVARGWEGASLAGEVSGRSGWDWGAPGAKALSWDSRVACSKDHLRATV